MREYTKSTMAASIRNAERALKELNELRVGVPIHEIYNKLSKAISHIEVSKQEAERALRFDEELVAIDKEAAE